MFVSFYVDFVLKAIFYYTSRITCYDCTFWDIMCDDRPCGYNCTITDSHTAKNYCTMSNPNIVSNDSRLIYPAR